MPPVSATSKPPSFIIPDFFSYCKLELHTNRNHRLATVESERWILDGDPDFDEATRRSFLGLKAGKFASMAYSGAGYPQLRACSDFLNWFFHLDNLSDDMDDRAIDNIANVVMSSLHHPNTYCVPVRLNRMTKEFVFPHL